ncbi:AraC family transcriptional regulator [Aureisphaera galaxeae]|uniref:SRPBCC family protein n=1 Tax=Aureisphaera galaxeae TaxID=1538023 RepID=UPI0023503275|nr:SRPBCC family protein [Aureisphaera galaxeae]MDC8006221.1 AraC family transcriptional regulator [Aureisphaera galaxeae]
MKLLKYLFYLLLIVLIGGAVYFGTQDGTYDISESKTINAPTAIVFDKVNDLTTWEEWGPWKKEDTTMTFSYGEVTKGEGANYSWDGEMDGSLKTTNITPNKEILQDLTLLTPGGERNPKVYWNFEEIDGATKVTWGMKGEHTFMDKVYYAFSGMDFDGDMKKMHVNGLMGIASAIEEDMKKYSIDVTGIAEHGGGYYMYVTTSSRAEDLGSKMGSMLGQIVNFMSQNNIQQAGMPFTIYHETDQNTGNFIFSSAIPVKERIITPSGSEVLCGYMEPTSAVKTVLTGNYENLPETYEKAQTYIAEKSLIMDPAKKMFEVYANDPGEFPNPADWITEVYIPVFKDLRSNHDIIMPQ